MSSSGADKVDWQALERLRLAFLKGTAGDRDYWDHPSTLASYDATFAQRIGWKWDFVLAELARRGWQPPRTELVDWGCGTGIATRAFLDHFGVDAVESVRLIDRSPQAQRYAAQRVASRFPGMPVHQGRGEAVASMILLSHVLTELQPAQVDALLEEIAGASAVLWVEPGTYEASLALIAIRERLRSQFHVIAPCPHAERCGILAPGNESHWCHHFASPPPEVFMDPFWGRFAKMLEIDLRSLPVSYLVLDRNPAPALAPELVRTLGRPRLLKAEVRLMACTAAGVTERAFSRRTYPSVWKDARKDRIPSLWKVPDAE
ncbi:MAG: hypothetical protein JNK85_08290 [Verrucomicrobiales bacterium]|nr:hypothetical protein [Verrucomicrobiales bacterium]